jgi:hypothetical protein
VQRSALAAGVAFGVSLVLACKETPSGGPGGTAPSASGSPAASSGASPAVSAKAATATPTVATWTGKYTSALGSLYVFDGGEWAGVTWRGDEAGVGLGEGTLTLTVDPTTHGVHGTADGAIGDVVVVGSTAEDTLTASVLRKDPLDRGLTGTLVAKTSGDAMTGSMKLSVANARVIREVTFTLTNARGGS